jgi:outer membrane lipoprotein-sorting protein
MKKTIAVGFLMLAACGFTQPKTPDIDNYIQDQLKDLQMSVQSDSVRLGELRKINEDFANAYRFKRMQAYYKEPLMMRLESEVMSRKLTYVLNGGIKLVSAPGKKLREDVSNSPGKRQTLMDFGLLTPALMKQMRARFLKEEKLNGKTMLVFELSWSKGDDNTTRHHVWMDPQTKITAKRVWYDRLGKLAATFEYKDPVEVAPGIWVPTKVEVYNAGNRFGGRTLQSGIQVNKGLSDSLFTL